MTTLDYLFRYVIPTAYACLPDEMRSPRASAMLLAIALQESGAAVRRQQGNGPARGFWQFETAGVIGVRRHQISAQHLSAALIVLRYPEDVSVGDLHRAIEHNDVLAAIFARLLLWTLPNPLPESGKADIGWAQYLEGWRPGRPRPEAWEGNFTGAWTHMNRWLDA